MPVINHGTITGGTFFDPITNDPTGTIENGTFKSTVTNNGAIKGGIFQKKPEGVNVASGYTLKVNSQMNGSYDILFATINTLGSSGYVIPNSYYNTSVTIKYSFTYGSSKRAFPIDVTFGDTNDTPCLLKDWAQNVDDSIDPAPDGGFLVTFTAPPANADTADTVTLSMLTRLVIDKAGYPVGTEGGTQDYSGNGWNFDASNNTLTLESGDYDFSGEENALGPLNPDVHLVVEPGATLTGGAFAKEPKGAGTFKTVTLNGTGSITAVNGLASDWAKPFMQFRQGPIPLPPVSLSGISISRQYMMMLFILLKVTFPPFFSMLDGLNIIDISKRTTQISSSTKGLIPPLKWLMMAHQSQLALHAYLMETFIPTLATVGIPRR